MTNVTTKFVDTRQDMENTVHMGDMFKVDYNSSNFESTDIYILSPAHEHLCNMGGMRLVNIATGNTFSNKIILDGDTITDLYDYISGNDIKGYTLTPVKSIEFVVTV